MANGRLRLTLSMQILIRLALSGSLGLLMASTSLGSSVSEVAIIKRHLDGMPPWATAFGPNAKDQVAAIQEAAQEIQKYETRYIEAAITRYLTDARLDSVELALRLDNAAIVCVFICNVPLGHPFRRYFGPEQGGLPNLLVPGVEEILNKGRSTTEKDIERFVTEFGRLLKAYGRREPSKVGKGMK